MARDRAGHTTTRTVPFTVIAPPSQTLLLGASQAAYSELETALGAKMAIRRWYGGAMPDHVSKCAPAVQDQQAGRASWASFTSIPDAATAQAFFDSVTHRMLVTYLHEVNEGPKTDPATFKATNTLLHDAAAGNPLVLIAPILTANPYRTGDYLQWVDNPDDFDVLAIDAYHYQRPPGSPPDPKTNSLGTARTMQYLLGAAPTYAASIGKPIAIGEFGFHPWPTDPQRRPNWLVESVAYLKSLNAVAACYFHSGKGSSGPWWLDKYPVYTVDENDPARSGGDPDPDSVNAFRSLLST
jgi:hypothetical protein